MDALRAVVLIFSLFATVSGHNITDILSEFPEYSVFNSYLTQTKLADDINSRQTITVLVLNNTVVKKITTDQPLLVVKNALSIHVLLDFFDLRKLLTIGGGSVISTTLYQTTGKALGSTGFVNITDVNGGKVKFRSADPGSNIDSLYTKTVREIPYNISVLEISSPIISPEILTGSAPSVVNISSVLESAGCKTFLKLITETGVLKVYESVETKGLTVFAPSDAAFKSAGLPNLDNLSNADLVSLLLYHAIPSYVPKITLTTVKGPIKTLATNSVGKYDITVGTNGNSITLSSGVDASRVENTAVDLVPLCVFTVDHVLLPIELFPKSPTPSPAPAPAPATETSPSSASTPAPASRPIASSPAPVAGTPPAVSPQAHPISSPADGPAPADSPSADDGDTNAAGDGIKAPVLFQALVIASISGIISYIAA